MPIFPDRVLRLRLVMDRPMTSLVERSIAAEGPDIRRCQPAFVRGWVDTRHKARSDTADCWAYRAITDQGQLFWLVEGLGASRGYASEQDDPFAAMDEARQARVRRRRMHRQSDHIRAGRWKALLGRRSCSVTREDVLAAGLSPISVAGFLRRCGLGSRQHLPARIVAVMSLMDRRAGFAMIVAQRRVAYGPKAVSSGASARA